MFGVVGVRVVAEFALVPVDVSLSSSLRSFGVPSLRSAKSPGQARVWRCGQLRGASTIAFGEFVLIHLRP